MSASPAIFALPAAASPEVWLSQSDVLTLCGRKRRWLFAEAQANRIRSRITPVVGPNGRLAREYALSSLPEAAQRRYYASLEQHIPDFQQTSLPLLARPHLVTNRRVKIPAARLAEAEQRHRILEPILAMTNPASRSTYAERLQLRDGTRVDSQARMIRYQIEQAGERGESLNERTIKRWLKAHRQNGLAGLARQKRKDAGQSRFFAEHRDAAALVAYLHLSDGMSPGLSAQACHDMLRVQRELVGLSESDLPHYDTVRSFLHHITPALRVFAKRGRKEFGERMMPYLSRAYNEYSNQIWVSDTMLADVEVLNDSIPGAPLGAPIRLRLTAIIDYRSRFVVGYSWAWEGSSASIASALRNAVLAHGPCDLWYCDNGKDYCKVAKGAVPGYMRPGAVEPEEWAMREVGSIERTGVLARLGIRVTHCIVHHPQSKHVERFFRTLHLTFCRLWSTYTGGKPSERPDQTTALMMVHRRALASGDLTKSKHPLASEFMRRFEQWLPTYHNKRGHRGQGMGYGSPAEVFHAHRNPNQRPAPPADELVWLLWEHKTAKVRECQVRVNKHDYTPQTLRDSHIMMGLNEQTVGVAYDPLDPSRVAVLDSAGHLLVMLETKRLIAMAPDDPATQAQIKAMQAQRSALTRGLKEQHLAVVRAGKQLGVLHPLQLLDASPGPVSAPPQALPVTPRKPRRDNMPAAAPLSPRQAAAALLRLHKESR